MERIRSIVCTHIIRSRKGEIIGSREIIHEIIGQDNKVECTTRGLLKLADGRVLVDKILGRSFYKKKAYTEINLLTGAIS